MTALGLALTSSSAGAAATVTIGQIDPFASVYTDCQGNPIELLQATVTSGPSYVVPPGGVKVTSWITNAGTTGTTGAGNGQMMEMQIFRKVADPTTYKVVGHDEELLKNGLNTFPTSIAVMPGDVLGLDPVNATSSAPEACYFTAPGDSVLYYTGMHLADGDQQTFVSQTNNERLNIQAVVELAPGATPTGASAFSFGKTKDNAKKGTATITVDVPGPGTVDLSGKGVEPQRAPNRAVASKAVSKAGPVKLLVKPKGKTKHKLSKTGKDKVQVNVTYTPTGGNPASQSERVKLIKKH